MTDPIVTFLESKLDEYLDDLRTLVGIDSGSFDKAGVDAVNDWIENRLGNLGFVVERLPQDELGDNLLGVLGGNGRGNTLLIGHSDTVFPAGTAKERPMTIDGDTIHGPGTCDMKAGLLTGIYAVQALKEINFDKFETINYLCVSDEEIGGARHSKQLVQSESTKADYAFTLEAARENGDIVTARKGLCWYLVEAFGISAHAGVEPEKGRNAILALAKTLIELNKLNGLKPGMTVNPGVIEGGSAPNVVPDYAKARVDLRTIAHDDIKDFEEAFQDQLKNFDFPGTKMTFKAEDGSYCPPMERTPAIVELENLAGQVARELGFEVKGASTGGASDASIAAAGGTPVLDGLGPIGGLDHGPDEYIELSSIVPRTALLAKLIIAISQN
jgi:glutamate carboxypeptidase